MTGKQPIPIQPKPSVLDRNDHGSDPQPSRPRRVRSAVLVACDPCRRLKAKCDGERPACRRCRTKGQECMYELPQDALSRTSARKEIANQLQRENLELRQLFHDLARRPEPEAYEIFQRLRSVDDPIALAHSIRQAELLLPLTPSNDRRELEALQQIEFDALGRSLIKVPARPWTAVAGDGIVSELLSSWFKWDNSFLYPFIDRELFTREMRACDPENSKYCSAFLVNAMCALRSYFSDTVDMVQRLSGQDLREKFFIEAKKQYDRERPTIPTIQGLWVMFALSSVKGEDKNGSLYRFAAYGMLKRSQVNRAFWSLGDTNPEDAEQKRAISKTVWAFFNHESITAINFRNIEIIPIPKIPHLFPEFSSENPANTDLFDQPFLESSPQPPFVEGAINVFCRVATLMNRVLELRQGREDQEHTGQDDPADLRRRIGMLAEVDSMYNSLSSALRFDHNFIPQTCFLRIAMNTVVHGVLRPLHPDMVLNESDGTTVKTTIMRHSIIDINLTERYLTTWGARGFSTMVFIGPLNAGTVLLPLLPEERAEHMFSRVCKIMHALAMRMPVARYVMRGWQAAIWARKFEIPVHARPYFENLGADKEDLKDVPTNLVVAHVPTVGNTLADEWDDGELGFLLRKWSAMSI